MINRILIAIDSLIQTFVDVFPTVFLKVSMFNKWQQGFISGTLSQG